MNVSKGLDSHLLRLQGGGCVHLLSIVEALSLSATVWFLSFVNRRCYIGATVESQGTGTFSKAALYWSKK